LLHFHQFDLSRVFFWVGLLCLQWPFHAWNKHVTFLAMVQDPNNGYCNTCATPPTWVLQHSSFSGQHQTHLWLSNWVVRAKHPNCVAL
jgi:hypothetical protein